MKLSDLAALVTVRNHILTVINDKSVTEKGEHRYLNKVRLELDKKFVSIMKTYATEKDGKIESDVNPLFPNALTLVKVGGNGYSPTPKDLEHWRDIFEEAQHDKDFKIFTHDAINVTQLEIDADSQVRVRPTVEPRTIEVSPNIARTKKSQLTLPLDKVNETLEKGNVGRIKAEVIDGSVINVEKVDGKLELARVTAVGHSGDLNTVGERVNATVENVVQGDIEKLENTVEKLAEQNVKLTPAVVEDAVKPIKAPEDKKQKVLKSIEEAAEKATKADPEVEEKLKKAKADLAKQGRNTKKVKLSDDETG